MQVILQQDVKGTGKKGALVQVSDGYARNFLFPRKLAVVADSAAMNEYKSKEDAKEHHRRQELLDAQAQAKLLSGKTVILHAKAGSSGRLFGAVTPKEIAAQIAAQYQLEIDKCKLSVGEIKAYGSYECVAKIHTGVSAKFTVTVNEE